MAWWALRAFFYEDSDIGYEKNNMAHRFEVFRAPIDLALPIPSYVTAPPALPR